MGSEIAADIVGWTFCICISICMVAGMVAAVTASATYCLKEWRDRR